MRAEFKAVKDICARLGIERKANTKNQKLRDEVLVCLAKGPEKLNELVERGNISLYDLGVYGFVPRLYNVFAGRIPETIERCDARKATFHKPLDAFMEPDFMDLTSAGQIGKTNLAIIREVIAIYRETSGFRTFLAKPLSEDEKVSMMEKIREALDSNPRMQRKLTAMFSAPAS